FVILDEAQNTTTEQMKMFLTRLGFGSKAVITGDRTQVDLPSGKASGMMDATHILQDVEGIRLCEFTDRDVVRHPLVQEVVRAYVQDGVRAYREKGRPSDPAWAAQREADAARNRGDLKVTADAYGRAVQLSKADDPQRPERLNLYMSALLKGKEYRACVQTGL